MRIDTRGVQIPNGSKNPEDEQSGVITLPMSSITLYANLLYLRPTDREDLH